MAPKTSIPSDEAHAPTANRVASMLRSRINEGVYAPGQWLPTQRDLASELGVNRRAINAAVMQLAGEGLLRCDPGCRPVVLKAGRSGLRRVPVQPAAAAGQAAARNASSRLVALLMWHGGFEQRATSQQRIFWGMNQALAQAGCHAVFLDLGDEIGSEEENATREAARLRDVLDKDFAGVVFYAYAYRSNRELIQEVAERVPMVLIDRMLPGLPCDFVGVDNFSAMRDAARALIDLGHRRIAYMTRLEPINTVYDRLRGYQFALTQAGLPATVLTNVFTGDWDLFDSHFRRPPGTRPTALLCVNDFEAVKAAERLAHLGLRIPEDVSLVGFDDIVQVLPTGATLTTVAQPFEEIGASAARLVMERQAGSAKPLAHIELAASLAVRRSASGPPDLADAPSGSANPEVWSALGAK